jgi:L-fuconolactonase
MPIIDAQVHAYERNHPGRPWAAVLHGPAEVTGDDMGAAMEAVGVDGALLVSPFTMYRYDASYALEVGASLNFHATKGTNIPEPVSGDLEAQRAAVPPRHGRALVEQPRGDQDGVVSAARQLDDDLGG